MWEEEKKRSLASCCCCCPNSPSRGSFDRSLYAYAKLAPITTHQPAEPTAPPSSAWDSHTTRQR